MNVDFSNLANTLFVNNLTKKKDVREIPLFEAFNKLLNVLDEIILQLPKHIQMCYAAYAINTCLECLTQVTLAYRNVVDKKDNLDKVYNTLPILEVSIKHLIDSSKISQSNAARLCTLVELINKQTNAWRKLS